MTESEWLTSTDPGKLIIHVAPLTSDRKLHYYAIACCRRIAPLLPAPESLRGVDVLEQFVEGRATAEDVSDVNWHVEGAAFRMEELARFEDQQVDEWIRETEALPQSVRAELVSTSAYPRNNTRDILTTAAYFADATVSVVPWERTMQEHPHMVENRRFQFVPYIHDIFGNPFRPAAFDPACRTPTAAGVARQMYDARDFATMPILADALQDAGCEDADILGHVRDSQQGHVRGCWVVDLVLGFA